MSGDGQASAMRSAGTGVPLPSVSEEQSGEQHGSALQTNGPSIFGLFGLQV